jgi:ATP-dependent protease HslVU (ClpYQ) peptidase subunit
VGRNSLNGSEDAIDAVADTAVAVNADRYLRRLEAMMIVADKDVSLVLTGLGRRSHWKPGSGSAAYEDAR